MGILRADILTHSQLESAGGSVDFDGSGDYLTIPNHTAFHFTGDYTIDFYIKFSTNSGTQRIFGQRNSNASDISVLGEFASNNFYYYYSTNGSSTENMIIGTYGTNIELNTWHHVAIVSDGGVHHAYLDGVQTAVNANNSPPLNDGDSTWSIGRQGAYTANEFSGSIYGFRITNKALYKTNFTLSKFKPKVLPETILLCCVSSTSVTEAEVSAAGDITSNGDPQVSTDTPLLKEDITDTGVVFDGFGNFATSTYMVPPKGKTTERNRGRGLIRGGMTPNSSALTKIIQYIEMSSGGNTIDFGDGSVASYGGAGLASATRGVYSVGATANSSPYSLVNTLEFITIANTANAIDFGDLYFAIQNQAPMSNQTRGIFAAGLSPAQRVRMDFITIATTGNAQDFGDVIGASYGLNQGGQAGSTTRGLIAGGSSASAPKEVEKIQFVTFASLGDAQDFGDLVDQNGYSNVGASSNTRALFAGGGNIGSPFVTVNTIQFVTIATTGNAIDFGDLTVSRYGGGGLSNSTRGCFTGGVTYPGATRQNVIDFVNIATTGNASDFGDVAVVNVNSVGTMSDSHGGLS